MKFYGGRISLLPTHDMLYQIGNEHKFSYVIDILSKPSKFKIRKGASIVIEPIFDNDILLGGKIGRESNKKIPILQDGVLVKVPTQTYPYVFFFINREEQLILVEHNTTAFPDELTVFKHIIKHINRDIWRYGLEVDIKPLTTKGAFWNLVDNANKIYSINFILKAPNFLGKIYSNLKDVLNHEKEESNANQIEYKRSNEAGELKILPTAFNEQAVGWAEDGGGDWVLEIKSSQTSNRKQTYKSQEHLAFFEVDLELTSADTESLKQIYNKIDIGNHRIKGSKQ